MTISKAQITILHVAKSKLAMDDDTYRSVLAKCAGVTSSTELDVAGFTAVMGFFEYCGFAPKSATGANYGNREGMATYAQLELIRTLWLETTRTQALDEPAMNKWLVRCFKVSSLRFLTKATAPRVITALKSWKSRAA